MDPKLQAVIEKSTVLSDETRQKLVASADRLTPEQLPQVIAILEKAEAKKTELEQKRNLAIRAANLDYVAKVKEFFQHGLPKALKKLEERDREKESSELDSILSELDNV